MSGLLRLSTTGLGLLLAFSGCGQKGALYLPDPAPQAVSPPPTAPAADEASGRRKGPHPPDPATVQ